MPSPKAHRNGVIAKGKVAEKAMSFHGRGGAAAAESLRRPRTVSDLRSTPMNGGFLVSDKKLTPTKVLFNVAIQGTVGIVQVLMRPESTVRDLICAALKQYVKERWRPMISSSDADEFDLHYSQFSLESNSLSLSLSLSLPLCSFLESIMVKNRFRSVSFWSLQLESRTE